MGFVKRMDQNEAKHGTGIRMEKGGGTRLFEW